METERSTNRITCIFTGDIMPGARRVTEDPSPALKAEFRMADMVVGNLESPFSFGKPEKVDTRKIPLWSHADNVHVLKDYGLTHAGLNNNHIFDLFESGLDDTLEILGNAGIRSFGINYKRVSQFSRTTVNGITVGMAAVNWVETKFAENIGQDYQLLDLGALRSQCDFLVMLVHWGDDHNIYINPDQQRAARLFIDRGADLVIGHHPHVPQGWEIYRGKHIFYSLGNFIFTPSEEYDELPYRIRYEDSRENVLFQRITCKIGIYVGVEFNKAGYEVRRIKPVYRESILPAPLPSGHQDFFDGLKRNMNNQIEGSVYRLNESEKKRILLQYTLPLILKHPAYWPILLKKVSVRKTLNFINWEGSYRDEKGNIDQRN